MHLLLSICQVSPLFRSHSCMQYAPNLDPLRPYLHLQKHPKRQINAIHGHLLHPQATNQPPASMPDPAVKKTTTTSQSLSCPPKVSGENRPILPLATANTESRRRVIGSGLLDPCLAALFQGPF
ncbi:hypothetical protein H0G86_005996 [Trichoderma simmonsii]|uniref:Uncharacterized protein n=1 Tax=Trichoderma simmonsii TaxID=1491479 RepID=A0A8G0LAM8_9HYPO|nr:hypothetical protein H0G86_005996 [Trichoderma simmonsii]